MVLLLISPPPSRLFSTRFPLSTFATSVNFLSGVAFDNNISLPSSFFFPHLFSLVFSGMSPLWLSLSLLSHYVQVYGSLCATSRVILISSSSCPSWLISQSLLAQSRLSPVLGLNVSRNRCIIQWRELTSHRGRSRSRSRSGSGSGRRSGRRSRSRGTMLCI